jgi:uncharacterized protein YcbK (DUF882 family)
MMSKLNKNRVMAVSTLLAAVLVGGFIGPASRASGTEQRQLSFFHTHTQRKLQVTYAVNGKYVESALAEINAFLADFRNGEQLEIDPELLDLIYEVRESLGGSGAFEVISAYRSPETNEMLRSRSSGVAKNSQHVLGNAIDLRLRGVTTVDLRDAAISLQRGGVGYYPASDFVHIDTGRVRRW